mgnify:CR=1 FL=1
MTLELFPPSAAPDMLCFERLARSQGFGIVAGIDEAGRGPLAGPVVAAAVVLPDGVERSTFRRGSVGLCQSEACFPPNKIT